MDKLWARFKSTCSHLKGSILCSVEAPGFCRICLKLFTGRMKKNLWIHCRTGCGARQCACDPFPSPNEPTWGSLEAWWSWTLARGATPVTLTRRPLGRRTWARWPAESQDDWNSFQLQEQVSGVDHRDTPLQVIKARIEFKIEIWYNLNWRWSGKQSTSQSGMTLTTLLRRWREKWSRSFKTSISWRWSCDW